MKDLTVLGLSLKRNILAVVELKRELGGFEPVKVVIRSKVDPHISPINVATLIDDINQKHNIFAIKHTPVGLAIPPPSPHQPDKLHLFMRTIGVVEFRLSQLLGASETRNIPTSQSKRVLECLLGEPVKTPSQLIGAVRKHITELPENPEDAEAICVAWGTALALRRALKLSVLREDENLMSRLRRKLERSRQLKGWGSLASSPEGFEALESKVGRNLEEALLKYVVREERLGIKEKRVKDVN